MVNPKLALIVSGACLLMSAASPVAAQSNGCELTPAPLAPSAPATIAQYMLAKVTDTCPITSYKDYRTVLSGEYDSTQLDYVRDRNTYTKMPQQIDEVMVLIPTGGVSWYQSPANGTTNLYTRDAIEGLSYIQFQRDTAPPFGSWEVGLNKAETTREGLDQVKDVAARFGQQPLGYLTGKQENDWSTTLTTTDGCGTPQGGASYRLVEVTATCTEDMFPHLADPGVPNFMVGGTQFATTTNSGNWLLIATAARDDGNGELMILIPVSSPDGDPYVGTVAGPPPAGMSPVTLVSSSGKIFTSSMPAPAAKSGHDYYLSWVAGGKLY